MTQKDFEDFLSAVRALKAQCWDAGLKGPTLLGFTKEDMDLLRMHRDDFAASVGARTSEVASVMGIPLVAYSVGEK